MQLQRKSNCPQQPQILQLEMDSHLLAWKMELHRSGENWLRVKNGNPVSFYIDFSFLLTACRTSIIFG